MKISIIGAGLGGLTFACMAIRDGHEVTIYDKNSVPGGVVALLEHEGYKFEQGPLLVGDMLEGEPIYEFLKELGITLDTERADRDIYMPDYKMETPKDYQGPYWRRDRLKELFPTNLDTAYNTFLESGARGIGKSEIACGCVCTYLMYRVMCMKNPLEFFHLKQTEKICFAFMNIKLALAEEIATSKF